MQRKDYNRSTLAGFAVEPLEARQLLATFNVTTAANTGPGSLRQAVLDANAAAGTDIIDFTGATFSTPQTITLTSQLTIDDVIDAGLTINGPTAQVTISGNNVTRIFNLAVNESATMNDLTLTLGRAAADGGAIFGDIASTLNFNSGLISNSTATGTGRGGAIGSGGTVNLTNSDITGNTAINGGGLFGATDGAITVTGGTISNNTTPGVGGGIFSGADVTLTGATVSGNTAADQGGGGLYVVGPAPVAPTGANGGNDKIKPRFAAAVDATLYGVAPETPVPAAFLDIIDSTISGNISEPTDGTGGLGGGITAFDATMNIIRSRIINNEARGSGPSGGGFFFDGSAMFMADSEVAGNTALSVSAIEGLASGFITQIVGAGAVSNVTVLNSTISNNAGNNFNAGLFSSFTGADTNVVVNQSTITENSATSGANGGNGGLNPFSGAGANIDFTIANTILSGNTGGAGATDPDFINDSAGTSTVTSRGGNFLGSAAVDANPNFAPQIVPLGSDNIGNDPQVGPLAFNGGPTRTHLPDAGSPVINDGVNGNAVDPGPDNILGNGDDVVLTTDQRGLARISGGTVDIGSVEVQGGDVDPPSVSAAAFGFQTRQTVSFTFDEDINPASIQLADLVLRNDDLAGNPVVPTPAGTTFVYDAGTRTLTFTFNPAGGLASTLPRGNYEAILPAGSVTDTAGNGLAPQGKLEFFVTPGDANRDRTVNLADFGIVRTNFGQSGRTFGQGDFNYDGTVNLADFGILRANFGTTLAPPSPDDLFGGGNGGGDDDDGRDFF